MINPIAPTALPRHPNFPATGIVTIPDLYTGCVLPAGGFDGFDLHIRCGMSLSNAFGREQHLLDIVDHHLGWQNRIRCRTLIYFLVSTRLLGTSPCFNKAR